MWSIYNRTRVFERAPGINFQTCLNENKLEQGRLFTLLAEIGTGIATAHEAGCVNRDIKPDNVVIREQKSPDDPTEIAKIVDQGLTYDLKEPSQDAYIRCGTPHYLAPEMINGHVQANGISPAADVFAYGVMIMKAAFPEMPSVVENFGREGHNFFYPDNKKPVTIYNREGFVKQLPDVLLALQKLKHKQNTPQMQYTDKQLLFLGNLLKDCLAQNPKDRPSAAQAAMLVQIFNIGIQEDGKTMPYEEAKKLAETDRPKAIPIAIRTMIADPETHQEGLKALEELVKADPSYEKTPSYGVAMLYKDRYLCKEKQFEKFNILTWYKNWASLNENAAQTLKEQIYIKGTVPTTVQNISVPQDIYDVLIIPDRIPNNIMTMIADPKKHQEGLKALEELVKADPSYEATPSYGVAMLYKDRYSHKDKVFSASHTTTDNYSDWRSENKNSYQMLLKQIDIKGNPTSETKNILVPQDIYNVVLQEPLGPLTIPDSIPDDIMTMITNPKTHQEGVEKLNELIIDNPAYMKTPSYGLAIAYQVRYSPKEKQFGTFYTSSDYTHWARQNKVTAKTLKKQIYVEGTTPTEGQNIPVHKNIYSLIHKLSSF